MGKRRVVYECIPWFQQQHEKRRKKRDFDIPSGFSFGDYPGLFDDVTPTRFRQALHNQRNRGAPNNNLFPDPLYKEQWYL
ncbi:hypothetical protein PV326_012160, partial [Microctonus aethiopoides]